MNPRNNPLAAKAAFPLCQGGNFMGVPHDLFRPPRRLKMASRTHEVGKGDSPMITVGIASPLSTVSYASNASILVNNQTLKDTERTLCIQPSNLRRSPYCWRCG